MKHYNHKKPVNFKCFVNAMLFGSFCFTSSAWAEIECDPASANATFNILSPVGPVVGTANFTINGEPSVASFIVNFIAAPLINPDGSQQTFTRIDYDFGGGDTITGVGVGSLNPTDVPGVVSSTQQVTYIAGTGMYQNVVSRFYAKGILSFLDNTGSQEGIGDLCFSEINSDDINHKHHHNYR